MCDDKNEAKETQITPEMIEAGIEVVEDWLSEQPYGYEDLGARNLVLRVLSLTGIRIQPDVRKHL
jgi:hypothetical protein